MPAARRAPPNHTWWPLGRRRPKSRACPLPRGDGCPHAQARCPRFLTWVSQAVSRRCCSFCNETRPGAQTSVSQGPASPAAGPHVCRTVRSTRSLSPVTVSFAVSPVSGGTETAVTRSAAGRLSPTSSTPSAPSGQARQESQWQYGTDSAPMRRRRVSVLRGGRVLESPATVSGDLAASVALRGHACPAPCRVRRC